jgi:hypothetical protein
LSHFVRGATIAAAGRRAPVYRTVLTALRAFLAAPQPLARPEDADIARGQAQAIVARILANPPAGPMEMLAIRRLCWSIDRRATFNATTTQAAEAIKAGWQAARKWLLRPRAD